jgi:hypothetical protein
MANEQATAAAETATPPLPDSPGSPALPALPALPPDAPDLPWYQRIENAIEDLALHRRATDVQLDAGHRQFEAVQARCDSIESNLAVNTEATARIDANTSELVSAFASLKGAFKVLEMIGKLAKPLSYLAIIGGAFASAWVAVKTGTPK